MQESYYGGMSEMGPSLSELGIDTSAIGNAGDSQEATSSPIQTPDQAEATASPVIEPQEQEADAQTLEDEAFASLSSQEKTQRYVAIALGRVQKLIDNGSLSPDSQEKALLAVSYRGTRSGEDFKALQAISQVLDSHPEANNAELQANIERYQRVQLPGGETFSLSEWNDKIAAASDGERQQLEQSANYGFAFPDIVAQENPSPSEESSETNAIQLGIDRLKQMSLTGELTSTEKTQLQTLQLAQMANGEIGVLLKARALRSIQESAPRVAGRLEQLEPQVADALQDLDKYLRSKGLDDQKMAELTQQLSEGNLTGILQNEKLMNSGDIAQLIFGRKLNESDMNSLLAAGLSQEEAKMLLEKHGKEDIALALLLLMMLAPAAVAVNTVKQELNSR